MPTSCAATKNIDTTSSQVQTVRHLPGLYRQYPPAPRKSPLSWASCQPGWTGKQLLTNSLRGMIGNPPIIESVNKGLSKIAVLGQKQGLFCDFERKSAAFCKGLAQPAYSVSGSGVTGTRSAVLMRGKNSKAAATAVSSMISCAPKCRLTAAKAASSIACPEICSSPA